MNKHHTLEQTENISAFADNIGGHVRSASGSSPQAATDRKFWFGLSNSVMEQLADNWAKP